MKHMLKITTKICILFILIMLVLNYNIVNADEKSKSDEKTADSGADVAPDNWKPDSGGASELFDDKVGVVLGAIRAIGIILSVGTLIVIGIKTLLGSAEEKSHYKEVMPGYLIGALLIFATTTIPSLIYTFMTNSNFNA